MKEQPECKVDEGGTKRWRLNGKLHREDGPAIECVNGTKQWCLNGKLHREDGPACEWEDGDKWWYLHGEKAHPETIVDYHLSCGTFCYYDPETQTLHFDESK